jgi:V8-like Glu-specific endopeptidase
LTDDTLDNMLLNLSGYPHDKPGTQWYHANRIVSTSDSKVYYQIDTSKGQSGSPVWREHNGHRHVVAIHTTGQRWSNSGIRIMRYVFDNLQAWKR